MVKVLFRVSVLMLGVFSLVGGVSLIINNIIIMQGMEDQNIISNLIFVNILTAVLSFVGTITSIFTLIMTENRGMKSYERILKSIHLSENSISSLKSIKIPKTDEMGSLGASIRVFIDNVVSYDKIKRNIIKKQKAVNEYIKENLTDPMLAIDYSYQINEANEAFRKTFQVENPVGKEIFEVISFYKYNLKAMSDSYEKHSNECSFGIGDQLFKTILNVKRFVNESGFQEYILVFSQTEKDNEDKDDEFYSSYAE